MRFAMGLLGLLALACKHDIDWSSKTSWRECAGAIDAWHDGDATPPCSALHMCASEAQRTQPQRQTLDRMVAAAPKCAAL
jgi:hypothetical protein